MLLNHFALFLKDKILIGLLLIIVIAVLALFIGLSFFNFPSADDFCFAAKAQQLGFFSAQVFWYEHWSGRYTLNLLWTALMQSKDIFQIYRFPPIVLLLSTGFGMSFLIARITQGSLSTLLILLSGGVAMVLLISGAPDVAQTFYWLGGSLTYQVPNILFLFLLGLLIWRETTVKRKSQRKLAFIFSSLLIILIVGANEISMIIAGITLCCGFFYALWAKHDTRLFWLGLLLIAVGASLASVLAPGNYERYASLEKVEQLRLTSEWAALLCAPWVLLRIAYWLSNPGLWAATLILLAATFHSIRTEYYVEGRLKRSLLILPVIWIVTIFTLNAIGFWINRYPLPERAESVVWLLFLLGWFPSFIIFTHYLMGEKIKVIVDRRWIRTAVVLLMISLLGSPNIFEAYKDAYRGYRFAQEMRDRIHTIQTAKDRGETNITVGSLSRPPRTLFAAYLETDSRAMRNQCMSDYYGVQSITLGPPKNE